MSRIMLSNDRLLRSVINKSEAIQRWPFLNKLKSAAPPEGCSSCQRKKYEKTFRTAAEETKRLIVKLSPEEIADLKRIMGLAPGTVMQVWCIEDGKTVPYNL